MSSVLTTYLKHRLRWLEFMGLAILMSLLVRTFEDSTEDWLTTILFLFFSFLVFRLLDDAGSVMIDRETHPDRIYLNNVNFPIFLRWCSFVLSLYFIVLYFWSSKVLMVIGAFAFISILFYLVFSYNNFIIQALALLKYPILIYSAGVDNFLLCLVVLVMMATYDWFENGQIRLGLLGLLTCGILNIGLVPMHWVVLFTAIACLIAVFLRNTTTLKYLPILYFPILYFTIRMFYH